MCVRKRLCVSKRERESMCVKERGEREGESLCFNERVYMCVLVRE